MGRRLFALFCALALALSLTGCVRQKEYSTTVFAMDTVMTLTVHKTGTGRSSQDVLADRIPLIYDLEKQLSATDETSAVSAINRAGGAGVEVSANVAALLHRSLELGDLTGGALDITARPALKAWGFTTGEYRVPGEAELADLTAAIDYTAVEITDETRGGAVTGTVTLPAGMELDLGAVAKGQLGDILRDTLKGDGVESALLDLGQSTIVAIGGKGDGSPWRIGVQNPAGTDYLGVLELKDAAMGTSGSYQRYFEDNGVRYCHIIDPDTAAPVQNGLASVTVVADSALLCDALSTALFVMGLEEGTAFWRAHPELGLKILFITSDGSLYATPGMGDAITLTGGYSDREVTVLE